MTDLEKVQKTLSDVFDYLNNKNDNEVSKRLMTEVGDAHRIVENLAIHGVTYSADEAISLFNFYAKESCELIGGRRVLVNSEYAKQYEEMETWLKNRSKHYR